MMKMKEISSEKKKKMTMMMKIIKTPIRVLCKARDFYIRSITSCASHPAYGQVTGLSSAMPRSFSTSSSSYGSRGNNFNPSDQDLRELIRANTTSGVGFSREELELFIAQQMVMMRRNQSSPAVVDKVPRSASASVGVGVGMGRIDEDKASSFRNLDGDEYYSTTTTNNNNKKKNMFPRSKSYGVSTKGNIGL